MTQQDLEQTQQARGQAAQEGQTDATAVTPEGAEAPTGEKLVPVTEAIKHRRRAQQAELKLHQVEQQLKDLQTQLEGRAEQLATAEAQRDEIQHQMGLQRLKAAAERQLLSAGVDDLDTAMTLLEKRVTLDEELEGAPLQQAIEQLLQDKPLLLTGPVSLPGRTASARGRGGATARIAQAAARAAQTGSRRDIAEYLRLRRSAAGSR